LGYIPGVQPLAEGPPVEHLKFRVSADKLTLNDGDHVATWTELIIGNSPVQATDSKRPIFKTNIINGLPIVRFDNSASQGLLAPAKATPTIATASYYTVVKYAASVKGTTLKNGQGGGGIALGVGGNDFDGNGNNMIALYEYVRWINSGIGYGTAAVLVCLYTDAATTTPKIYKNGTLINSYAGGAAGSGNDGFAIGESADSSRCLTGDIAEIAVYDVDHSTDAVTRAAVEEYFRAKYNLW
jgi:hypothetical protein